jgi:hypothetical protein
LRRKNMSKKLYTGLLTIMTIVLGGTIMYGSEVLAQSSDTRPDVVIDGGNNTGTNTTPSTNTGTDTNTTPSTNTGTGDTSKTNTSDKRFTCQIMETIQ